MIRLLIWLFCCFILLSLYLTMIVFHLIFLHCLYFLFFTVPSCLFGFFSLQDTQILILFTIKHKVFWVLLVMTFWRLLYCFSSYFCCLSVMFELFLYSYLGAFTFIYIYTYIYMYNTYIW